MKKVTIEEYSNALKSLEFIKSEELKYEKLFNYNKKFQNMTQIFESVILSLTKTNDDLKRIAKNNVKNFLKDYIHNTTLYNLYKGRIYLLIYNFYVSLSEDNPWELDSESQVLLNNNEKFTFLLDELKTIAIQIHKNNLEINKIQDLIVERKKSINIKIQFQKQSNKQRKIRKKDNRK